eukprot:m.245659 g.245659  ORF g.245659 m.245659 type:complete len:230 (-) comp10958_c1_seq18:95-784(-)
MATRLVRRKGAALLVELLPAACRHFDDVNFVIAGDGPWRSAVESACTQHKLESRVTLLGGVAHDNICDVLTQGQIFLNVSLTDAFCVAIVEAACCGLLVVSTAVGGIPEVLPDDMTVLVPPTVSGLLEGLGTALLRVRSDPVDRHDFYRRAAAMYNYERVAAETEEIYRQVTTSSPATSSLSSRLSRLYGRGILRGKLFVLHAVITQLLLWLVSWLQPAARIELAVDWM